MKKLGSLAACLIFLGHLSAQHFGILDDIAETEKARWAAGAQQRLRLRDLQNSADNRSDIRYCRLHWTVDPAVKYIRGEVMTRFEPTENLSSLDFDFSEALTMDSVVFHGQHLAFSRSGNIIQVNFPQALPAAAPDSLTFFYQGVPNPDSTGFGSFEVEQHAGTPVLWTLSEPYGAMEWWPCKQALNDKIEAVDIFITCPENYRAASNGLLKSETSANGWKTAHWQHRYPIPAYLICMAVTNYTTFSVPAPFGSGSTEILNYVYPESLDDAQIGVAQNVAHYQLFSELFGEYPFKNEKYGHAQFGYLGGMEHQTMTFVGGFGYELLAHELAHHWFGDKVTCGSWQDIWLNEGFATYLSGLCYERLLPQFWVPFKLDRIKKVVAQPDGSVWVEDTSTVSRVFNSRLSYAKGGMVLHMLRWVCGDSAFFAGVRNYVNDPALSYGYARTADLKAHLEAASGKNLDAFFADWIYGQGYPSYNVNWTKNAANEIRITLSQTPSHPSVAFFEMPVPVKLKNDSRDTTLVLQHTFSGQEFTVTLDFAPTELVFDPDIWLISKDNLVVNTREPLELRPMEIRPNPAKGKFFVRLEAAAYEQAALRLWTSDGKLALQQNVPLMPGPNEASVGVEQLPAGRYLLRLEGDGWLAERAVILQ